MLVLSAATSTSEESISLVPVVITVAVLLLGAWLLSSSRNRPSAGCKIGSLPQTGLANQDVLCQGQGGYPAAKLEGSTCTPKTSSAVAGHTEAQGNSIAEKTSRTSTVQVNPQGVPATEPEKVRRIKPHYRLARHDMLPPLPCNISAEIWEVCTPEDAGALLDGCPFNAVICCSFTWPYADGMEAQDRALKQLAKAQPAGFVFAAVNMKAAPEVATWAGVSTPLVRLMMPDGSVIEDIRPPHTGNGELQKKVLGLAAQTAKLAAPKLEKLAQKYPGALHDEVHIAALKGDTQKMQQRGLELLNRLQATVAEEEAFKALCQLCSLSRGGCSARVRHVVAVTQLVRRVRVEDAVPLFDLARRLASVKALGGSDPGALEALELLLDAVLGTSLNLQSFDATCCSLALQCLTGCFGQVDLHEALLPVVGQVVRTDAWGQIWDTEGAAERKTTAVEVAASTLLLNASVALRSARWRAEHQGLLAAAVDVLRCSPANEQVSLAVGNLLAVGSSEEQGKRTLQAQPQRPTLRTLAAAVFHGELEGPDGAAFPAAWSPPEPAAAALGAGQQAGDAPGWRRPPRAAIPARHRVRRGGG